MPPLFDQVAALVAERHPTVKADDVHRQAWRDFLVTTAGRVA